ncbi:MAG: phosphate ABC transporter permease PstA [Bacillota bacterium]
MRKNGLGYWLCLTSAVITLCLCLGIIAFLFAKGAPAINWQFLTESPELTLDQGLIGGILSPLVGTLLLTTMGILLALPWAAAMAIYLSEYGSDKWWTNLLRMGNDVLAGVPTIVIALFGLILFSYPELSFLSMMVEGVEGGRAFGRSFFVAAITMAVMVLPYVCRVIEEAIRAVPFAYREASYALGVSKWRTIRKVVLPAAGTGIMTGTILGIGRIAADVAIVWFCLGATLNFSGPDNWWEPGNWLETLRSAGGTLTSYIYNASPAGAGNAPAKAYGAALVLVVMILLFNGAVHYINRLARMRS